MLAALIVVPGVEPLVGGVVPAIADDFDMEFVMPWIGFILAGAAGLRWSSYGVAAREYGGPLAAPEDIESLGDADEVDEERLKSVYALVFGGVPAITFLLVREPVDILSVAGVVAAAHTPVVVLLTLDLNRRRIPRKLRPGAVATTIMVIAALWYSAFAIYHFATPR